MRDACTPHGHAIELFSTDSISSNDFVFSLVFLRPSRCAHLLPACYVTVDYAAKRRAEDATLSTHRQPSPQRSVEIDCPNWDPKNPIKDRASRRRRYGERQRFPKRLSLPGGLLSHAVHSLTIAALACQSPARTKRENRTQLISFLVNLPPPNERNSPER